MRFRQIIEREVRDRNELYDQLIDGDIDVALVRSSDPSGAIENASVRLALASAPAFLSSRVR